MSINYAVTKKLSKITKTHVYDMLKMQCKLRIKEKSKRKQNRIRWIGRNNILEGQDAHMLKASFLYTFKRDPHDILSSRTILYFVFFEKI